ncbi:MAG: spermidine synthase, partial [Candidatus Binatia bacterium]
MGGSSRREARQQPGSDAAAARLAPPAIASSTLLVAALLFVSGACALTYQLTWLRLLRLVFGHSTAASAAVLGIFMGGLGLGAIVLGRRADRHRNPLRLYALLEIGIAATAAATPFLIHATRDLYTGIGGSAQLGVPAATALRLLLSIVVLGVPTFLMGGTLSAAARAVEVGGEGRWRTAALYGCNTLGAVTGVLLANFVLLESLGTRSTLLAAAAANAVLAAAAWLASQRVSGRTGAVTESASPPDDLAVRRLVLATAVVAGAAFLLMELVWYRMLAPLLGGSTYTFGVILAVALLGIGIGGLAYALEPSSRRKVTIGRLSLVTALEALCAIVPLALGDR